MTWVDGHVRGCSETTAHPCKRRYRDRETDSQADGFCCPIKQAKIACAEFDVGEGGKKEETMEGRNEGTSEGRKERRLERI